MSYSPFCRLVVIACFGLVLCLGLTACENSKAKENFEKVEFRMTEAEVIELLGQPSKSEERGGMKICIWEHSTGELQVTFTNGIVTQKGGRTSERR